MNLMICVARDDGTATVVATSNPEALFEKYRQRWTGKWLPVAAIEIEQDSFTRITGWEPPITLPMRAAARIFGRVGVDQPAMRPLMRHLHHFGAGLAPLLLDWHRATGSAKEVGAPPEAVAYREKHFPPAVHEEIYG